MEGSKHRSTIETVPKGTVREEGQAASTKDFFLGNAGLQNRSREDLLRFRTVMISHPLFPSLLKQVRQDARLASRRRNHSPLRKPGMLARFEKPRRSRDQTQLTLFSCPSCSLLPLTDQFKQTLAVLSKLEPRSRDIEASYSLKPIQLPRMDISFGDYPELDEFCINYIAKLKEQMKLGEERCEKLGIGKQPVRPLPKRPRLETHSCKPNSKEGACSCRQESEHPKLEAALESLRQSVGTVPGMPLAKQCRGQETRQQSQTRDVRNGNNAPSRGGAALTTLQPATPSKRDCLYTPRSGNDKHKPPRRGAATQVPISPLQKISEFFQRKLHPQGKDPTEHVSKHRSHGCLEPAICKEKDGDSAQGGAPLPDLNATNHSKYSSQRTPLSIAHAIKIAVAQGDIARGVARAKTREKLPASVTSILEKWFLEHLNNPYPDDLQKQALALQCGISRLQVSNWFGNKRMRFKRKMMDDAAYEQRKELPCWPNPDQLEVSLYRLNVQAM